MITELYTKLVNPAENDLKENEMTHFYQFE
jgi:hypothetical protein